MITNKHRMPDHMVRAITRRNSKYSKGEADYSVTGLLRPAHMAALERDHHEEIDEDVRDLFWRVWGSTAHALFEDGHQDELQECRFFLWIRWNPEESIGLAGQVDVITKDGWLLDTKTTSVASLRAGEVECQAVGTDRRYKVNEDWVKQVNIYRYLVRKGEPHLWDEEQGEYYKIRPERVPVVKHLAISVALRDWSKARADASESYPHAPAFDIEIPLMSDDEVRDLIVERIKAHRDPPADCSPGERWARKTHWILTVNNKPWNRGKKFLTLDDAMAQQMALEGQGRRAEIVEIQGESGRCANYCAVAKWCEAHRARQGDAWY